MAYSDRVTSPVELAAALREPLTGVSYHTQHLLRHGLIELVRTERKRGATKHYYRAVVPPEVDDDEWLALPPALRRSFAGAILAAIWHDMIDAQAAGRLEDPGVHLARTPLELDTEGWDELSALLRDLGAAAARIQAESRARTPAHELRGSRLALLHFAAG
ncbi:MAG TPA: hypothetical protein VNS09_17255 [Solirubrobacter sp.]|nr:hypothetical protein [Solirubrobacter sp.]